MPSNKYLRQKERMINEHLRGRGISDERVLEAFWNVERHEFVEPMFEARAYEDSALPISNGQTISQPYIVAKMTEILDLSGGEKVLEIGTGSGFQAAILASMGCKVYTVERHQHLFLNAKARFERLGINLQTRVGDGAIGWADQAPFDRIIVTAGAPKVMQKLCEQLANQGTMVLPVGDQKNQQLVKITRTDNTFYKEELTKCVFVPLIGKDAWSKDDRNA